MADNLIVSCPGCGKRYSVPPGVPPGQFQCQDCSAVVVYGQKAHAGGPRPGGGAAARKHAKAEAAKRRIQRDRARHADDGYGEDEEDGRHHRDSFSTKKAKDPMPYVLGAVTLAILVGLSLYFMGSTKTPAKQPVRKADARGKGAAAGNGLPGGTAEGPAEAPAGTGGGAEPAPAPGTAGGGGGAGEDGPKPAGGLKTAVRTGGGSEPKDVFKEVENPPTGGNYGKSQAALLGMLKDRRAEVIVDLDHLPDTPGDLRQSVDSDVKKVADVNSGSEGIRAQDRLVKVGRPAIPRVLGIAAKLDFGKYKSILDARDDCVVADAIDNVLREITNYDKVTRLQYTPQSNLGDYPRCIDEWYVWWYTIGYRRATFYRKAEDLEEKL